MYNKFLTPQLTFENVLWNGDDQVIVKKLLMEHIPKDFQDKIIWEFNKYVAQRNLDKIANEQI